MKLHAFLRSTLILIPCLVGGGVSAQTGKVTPERVLPELSQSAISDATSAARQALPQLEPLVREETYRNLGFDSLGEMKQAQLGPPLHLFMVRLDKLREFEPNAKTGAMLSETNEVLFPVLVSERPRTGLKMRLVDGKWRFGSFGASAATKALSEASNGVMLRSKVSVEQQFAVNIPVLHLYFIGFRDARGTLILTPVADDSRFKLQAGHSIPAQDIFVILASYAKNYKTGERLVD